jgi:aryl-alcohol dehydrogenase-like predicted oxidoreductase
MTQNGIAFRQLGSHGPKVFPLALGCMAMSGMYGPADETESIATIHAALNRGVNLLDTAISMAWDTMRCSSGAP